MSDLNPPPVSHDWDQWFDDQYELNQRIDRAIAAATEGKPQQARAALYAAVLLADLAEKIEHRSDFWGFPGEMASEEAAALVRSFAADLGVSS